MSASTLPQEILMEILSKLPAKTLVRFRCVSKFFCALIADHGFGVVHRSLSLTLPSRAGFLISIELRTPPFAPLRRVYYTLNFSPHRRGTVQANRVAYLDAAPFLISSSSDGLICVSKPKGDVAVCNVSTGQRIFLPRIQYKDYAPYLGYDSQSKRYKVLMATKMIDPESNNYLYNNYKYKLWVCTVGVDRSWREINNCGSYIFHPSFYDSNTCVYIDGVIYSHNSLNKHSMFHKFHIETFEVGCESFSAITLPDEISEKYLDFKNSALLEVGGRLAMVFVHLHHPILGGGEGVHLHHPILVGGEGVCYMDVWTWEKSEKCWEKNTITTIPLEWSRIIYYAKCLRFSSNHDGEIVLLCIYVKQLFIFVCNLKSEVWKKFDVSGVDDFPIFSYWEVTLNNIVDHVFPLE
nr:putative F-box protein At3g52320 [Ipomoea trifida]